MKRIQFHRYGGSEEMKLENYELLPQAKLTSENARHVLFVHRVVSKEKNSKQRLPFIRATDKILSCLSSRISWSV